MVAIWYLLEVETSPIRSMQILGWKSSRRSWVVTDRDLRTFRTSISQKLSWTALVGDGASCVLVPIASS